MLSEAAGYRPGNMAALSGSVKPTKQVQKKNQKERMHPQRMQDS